MPNRKPKVGDRIRITHINATTTLTNAFLGGIDHQAKAMEGKEGIIEYIDDKGSLFGTWGGLSLIPGEDTFEYID